MDILILAGAALTLLGIAGIIYSVIAILRARRAGLEDADLRDRLARIVPINLGALFVSMIGLMMVVVGVILA